MVGSVSPLSAAAQVWYDKRSTIIQDVREIPWGLGVAERRPRHWHPHIIWLGH